MSENENITGESSEKEAVSRNFIEQIIDKDLAEGVYDTINARFSPELEKCSEYKCVKAMLYCYVNLRKLKKIRKQ